MLTINCFDFYEIDYKCTFYYLDNDHNEEVKTVEGKRLIETDSIYEATKMFLAMLPDVLLEIHCLEGDRLDFIKELIMDCPKHVGEAIIMNVKNNETENAKEDI